MTVVRLAIGRDLAALAEAILPVDTRIRHSCPRCAGSDHGRPYLARPGGEPSEGESVTGEQTEVRPTADRAGPAGPGRVSLAHADGCTVLVHADGPVGVDIERPGAVHEATIAPQLAPGEPTGDPTRTWVRKEAVLKAEGVGLLRDPREIDVSRSRTVGSAYDVVDVRIAGWVCAVAAAGPVVIEVSEAPAVRSDRATR